MSSTRRSTWSDKTSGAQATGAAPGIKSIWNSTWRIGGRPSRSSEKTSGNSLTTDNLGMILGQPVHTNDDVETIEFNRHEVASSGWPFVFTVPGLVARLVTSLTLDSGGSISPAGFLPSILLMVAIIVAVVVVVVVVIVAVVVVGEGSSII
ncbi:hypothetical protein Tco_1109546 [Tanacetum coccineum]